MQDYPALLNVDTQTRHPIGSSESFLVGRNETADVCLADVSCSRHHFRIRVRGGRHFVEPLSPTNPTYHNGKAVAHPQAVEHGAILQAGRTCFQFLLRTPGPETARR